MGWFRALSYSGELCRLRFRQVPNKPKEESVPSPGRPVRGRGSQGEPTVFCLAQTQEDQPITQNGRGTNHPGTTSLTWLKRPLTTTDVHSRLGEEVRARKVRFRWIYTKPFLNHHPDPGLGIPWCGSIKGKDNLGGVAELSWRKGSPPPVPIRYAETTSQTYNRGQSAQ